MEGLFLPSESRNENEKDQPNDKQKRAKNIRQTSKKNFASVFVRCEMERMLEHYVVVENSKCLNIHVGFIVFAGSLEAAYSLNWGAREIWGKGGGETLALL